MQRTGYIVGDRSSPTPYRGDLVFFNDLNHVALAAGNGRNSEEKVNVYSFWPPYTDYRSNTVQDYFGPLEETTIEDLVAFMGNSIVVEFASPKWQ